MYVKYCGYFFYIFVEKFNVYSLFWDYTFLLYFYILLWLSLNSFDIFYTHYFIVFDFDFFYKLALPFRFVVITF